MTLLWKNIVLSHGKNNYLLVLKNPSIAADN